MAAQHRADRRSALPNGLVLREATNDDDDAIVALEVAAFGDSDGPAVRAYLDHLGGAGNWIVACDGDRIVSASARVPQRPALDGVAFDAAQIEYVVTDPAYQRHGLVRAQFDEHHARSAAAGHLAQFVGGIPYLYRRFGYGYGLDHPKLFVFERDALPDAPEVTVRPADASDIAALELLDRQRPIDGLRTGRDRARWELFVDVADHSPFDHALIAERAGEPVGWARLHEQPGDGYAAMLPFLAADVATTAALIRASMATVGDLMVIAYDHPGHVVADHLRALGSPMTYDLGIYTRVADPVAALTHFRSLLTDRLQASPLDSLSTRLEISLYERGVALEIDAGEVIGVESCPPVEDPTDDEGVGVAPDWFGALLFGRWGAIGLAERADDVLLGKHRRLMETLFPLRSSDVVGEF